MLAHVSSVDAGSLLPPFSTLAWVGAWLHLTATSSHIFPGLVSCIPEFRQFPDTLSGTITFTGFDTMSHWCFQLGGGWGGFFPPYTHTITELLIIPPFKSNHIISRNNYMGSHFTPVWLRSAYLSGLFMGVSLSLEPEESYVKSNISLLPWLSLVLMAYQWFSL